MVELMMMADTYEDDSSNCLYIMQMESVVT